MHTLLLALASILNQALAPATPGVETEELHCMVVLSIDLAFWDRWDFSRESEPEVAESNRVVRGQHFAPHVFVTHPAIDGDGMARIRQDLRILRPDGTVYFENIDLDAHSGPYRKGLVLRTQMRLGVFFEPEDALGTYRVEATVRDQVAGTSSSGSASIELVEYEQGEGFSSKEDLELWLTGYRSEPDPSRLVPAVLAVGRGGWEQERGKLHGALRDLFDCNAWLLPELLAQLQDADDATRHWILWIASRQPGAGFELASQLDGADLALWNEFSAAHDPLVDPVRGREDLNELWGMYWPRRSITPVIRLCSLLSGVETGSVADILLPSAEFPDGVPLWMVVTDASTRILVQGIEWDPLVRDYCEAILESEEAQPGVRRKLLTLLEGVPSTR